MIKIINEEKLNWNDITSNICDSNHRLRKYLFGIKIFDNHYIRTNSFVDKDKNVIKGFKHK
jgi:hypothetical protein